MYKGFKPKMAPVKIGDELDVKIEGIGAKGDGIARKEGFVLFVPNTKKGDEVRVRVTKVSRRVGFAEKIETPKIEHPEDTEDFGEDI